MRIKSYISKLLVIAILIGSFFDYFGTPQVKAAALYTWEKFNVEQGQEYQSQTLNYYGSDYGGRTVYPSMSVDKRTGLITLTGEPYYSESSGYYYNNNGSGGQVVYRYLQRDSCDNWENCYTETYVSYFIGTRLVNIDVKGTSTGTYVTSSSQYAYPNDRKHTDGFWYVSKGLNSEPTITINSSSASMTIGNGQDLVLSGTVQDQEGDAVTISATLPTYNITKSVTVTSTRTAKNWQLRWPSSELIGDNRINQKVKITADDQKGGQVLNEFVGEIIVDRTAPSQPGIVVNPSEWSNEDVQVSVTEGTDELSGIRQTEYRLGNGSWTIYTTPFTVSTEGVTQVRARSIDKAGNISSESTAEAKLVKSPPSTPDIQLQSGGWSSDPVEFEISGSIGYGDITYEYSIDGGSYTVGSSGLVTKEGTSQITARATNMFGQKSTENNALVTIDQSVPQVVVTPNGRDWSSEPIKAQVTVTDELSGIKPNSTYFKVTPSTEIPNDWEVLNDSEIHIAAEGQWYIHVKVTDNAGNTATYTSSAFKIQYQPSPPLNVKPVNVQNNQVTVTWDLPIGSYYTDGYVYELINNVTGATFQSLYPKNSITDQSVTGGNLYNYTLKVSNHVGEEKTTSLDVLTKPDAPDRLEIRKIDGDYSRADLTISPVNGAESYRIVVEDAGHMVSDDTVVGTSYTVTGLQPGSLNNIKVSALNATGEGDSNSIAYLALPGAPGAFSTARIDEHTIELEWEPVISAEYYNLDRFIDQIYSGTDTTFFDSGLQSGTSYTYRVVAANETGVGEYAELDNLMTLPTKPGNLAISLATTNSITLQWEPVQGADGYEVAVDGHSQVVNDTDHTFTSLSAGTEYKFTVVAQNQSGNSPSVSISGYTVPEQPAGITVTDIEETSANITWEPVYGADKYLVQINGTDYEVSSPNLNLNSLEGSRIYDLTVWAGNIAGYSAAGSAEFLTKPHAPSNVTVSKLSSNSITLGWEADNTAIHYRVVNVESGEEMKVHSNDIAFDELHPGKSYQFDLWTDNTTGESVPVRIMVTTKTLPVNPDDIIIDVQHEKVEIEFSLIDEAKEYVLLDEHGTEVWRGSEGPIVISPIIPGKEYDYELVAINDQGAASNPSKIEFTGIPGAPEGVIVSSILEFSIGFDLSNANKKGAESIQVYRDGKEIGKVSVTDKEFVDKKLKDGTNYHYEFKASNSYGISKDSKKIEATTLPVRTQGGGSGSGNGSDPIKVPDSNDAQNTGGEESANSNDTTNVPVGNNEDIIFVDIEKNFARDQIIDLANRGILKGTSVNKFEPDRAITRIEFVSMIVRALDISSDVDEKPFEFDDIDLAKWYGPEFKIAWDNEVTHGFSNKKYLPNNLITREQASKMLGNVMNIRNDANVELFSDGFNIADWAKSEVTGLTRMELVTGYPDGTFRPKSNLTRAEGAVLIYRSISNKNK
ncbi:fibronectin type III domain-containing protein [Paenibacillus tundrae]|uniref:fibronectin type III domain-containing protein n=1 Tax=Paenibacillus tundrae TaxID=528187 RepID=UPI0022A98DA5|nr:fibronectin type III domain-containing protein [Paenibacillus tundrae]MCZ1268507.1 hypothetical protein [Paenibacillus tundrae]